MKTPLFVIACLLAGGIALFGAGRGDLAHLIWYVGLVGGGVPIVLRTTWGMLKGEFASDVVAMLAIVTAVLLDESFAGAVVVLMQSGGEAIEQYGFRKASASLMELMKRAPRRARKKVGEQIEELAVEAVKVGDVLIVRPGELVPVDGTVVAGTAQIDESAVTGEPFAREKKEGDHLLSGTVNMSGMLEMRADRLSQESQYAKIVRLVQRAQEEKAPIQRLADRYAIWFTPLALAMAFLGYAMTGDLVTILSVLVVATPCPLILATPLAVMCGINRAAKEGIIVKGGAAMEQLGEAKGALFDKTGTITFGIPTIERIVSFGGEKEEELLGIAAGIEQFSSHSIAKGIVAYAKERLKTLPLPEDFQEIPGQGVQGRIGAHLYFVGSKVMVEERTGQKIVEKEDGQLMAWIARDRECIGALLLTDQIRPQADRIVEELKELGVEETAILTGDHKASAEKVAKKVGIEHVESELLPEQKVATVKKYRGKYEPILMIGDGINDAPALATATVGIAMGAHGTAISAEAADVVLLVDDLNKVPEAIRIGKRMLKIAKQSIWIGMGLSFALMVVASQGYIAPPYGALLQEIIDVAVILNALRVL